MPSSQRDLDKGCIKAIIVVCWSFSASGLLQVVFPVLNSRLARAKRAEPGPVDPSFSIGVRLCFSAVPFKWHGIKSCAPVIQTAGLIVLINIIIIILILEKQWIKAKKNIVAVEIVP